MEKLNNWSKPITQELAQKYLNNKVFREDFLLNYDFFNEDKNGKLYRDWILENINNTENAILEDIFRLAGNGNIFIPTILHTAHKILQGNYFQFTKLAVLEYLFDQKENIQKKKNVLLAKVALRHTKNHFIRFQAFLNLVAMGVETETSLSYIKRILRNTIYPTLYYRLLNEIEEFPKPVKLELVNLIIDQLKDKKFSQEVIEELLNRINLIIIDDN